MIEPGDPPAMLFDPGRAEAATARVRVQRVLALAENPDAEPPLDLEPVTETGSRYVDFLFPGLLGMNLMGTGMWGIGFAIADVRRRKFLKRLLVTPMRRSSFFLSFMLSRLVFLFMEMVVLAGFGRWILGVPFEGSLIAFSIVALLGALTFAGLGILVASRVRTIEGVSGLMNFVMMPMWLASGVFFSYERFPEATHPFIRLLPLTGLNDALRGVMIDGESLFRLWPELALMVGWCVLTFVVALRIFRWE
jgi:ABC-type multidrug transport system permease subunit